jgi:hypothetical protein
MNIDSQITTEIINTFVSEGTPILPIHDSYIVKRKDIRKLEAAMSKASMKILGVDLDYESRYGDMFKRVTKTALSAGSDVALENYIEMPFNLSEKTEEYKERYKLWKSRHYEA